jgi:hypothetical protein
LDTSGNEDNVSGLGSGALVEGIWIKILESRSRARQPGGEDREEAQQMIAITMQAT